MSPTKFCFSALLSSALCLSTLDCRGNPPHETGEQDSRPAPRNVEEARAQQADKLDRQKALQDHGLCTPEAIRSAPSPDERFWHCRGEDWDGSTKIQDLLNEFKADPKARAQFCADTVGLDYRYSVMCEGTGADSATPKPRGPHGEQ